MLKWKRWFKLLFFLSLGWLVFVPITFVLRPFLKKRYILYIGSQYYHLFLDNVKYLFLYFNQKREILQQKNLEIYFLTKDYETYKMLKNYNLPVLFYPSFKAFKVLIATKILFVDHMHWFLDFKYYLLLFSKKIQLWHGIGFKYIELMNRKYKNKLEAFLSLFSGRYPKYDVVISTSKFYAEKVFSQAFRAKDIWITGYPRNDIFFRKTTQYDLLNTDKEIIKIVENFKAKGYNIILYAPTFRDKNPNFSLDKILNFNRLDSFLEKLKSILIIKPHPFMNLKKEKAFKNILFYDSTKDIYPLLKNVDCLITDYSSIYMDYLLINKPIIFFPVDLNEYISLHRNIQFDYNWITPGPKVFSQEKLEKELEDIFIRKLDKYKNRRLEIRKIAFDYIDGKASERIFKKVLTLLK